ncbi:MAG: hypothetical protein WBC71_15845 [Salaquimonas sp.]
MSESTHHNQPENHPVAITPQRRWWHEIPMVLFYAPIFFAILFLILRYRSFSAALNANWALKKGGLFPESKDAFTKRFAQKSRLIPASVKLKGGMNLEQAMQAFDQFNAKREDSALPFVLKPDDGIQGKSIHILQNADTLRSIWPSIAQGKDCWLLQDYVGGVEVAVFYVRENPAAPGKILSMTWKQGFEVIGDGKSTIAQLIASQASDQATRKRILRFNRTQLAKVPQTGEAVDLMPVRNHHLGATFQDISTWITPEMEQALISELDLIGGYNYGRLDIRAPDFDNLFAGINIKILETNALYSEPVHAYDPKYGLWDAYTIFVSYWAMAMRTGLSCLVKR